LKLSVLFSVALSGAARASVRRNIIFLIAEYLKEAGLPKSHSTLIDEAQLSNEFAVCDNVDLDTIYLEFSSFYQIKFGKKPRFVKKLDAKTPSLSTLDSRLALAKKRAALKTALHVPDTNMSPKDIESSQCLRVSSLSPPTHDDSVEKPMPHHPKPMSNHEFLDGHPLDWKEMTEMIFKDVVRRDLCVKWDDVMGQDAAKMIIEESVIYPMNYPHLFSNVQPWKG
jgi:katanin p60 ATPase-containing subunit A1